MKVLRKLLIVSRPKSLRHVVRVNNALSTLNWLNGFLPCDYPILGWRKDMVGGVQRRVDGLVKLQEPMRDAPLPREAFSLLMAGRDLYGDNAGAHLATFVLDKVALPIDDSGSPFVFDLLPDVDTYIAACGSSPSWWTAFTSLALTIN